MPRLGENRIPREKIDDVRERTNIVEIIKRHVELKRAGTASWKGLCPFHAEKTPSFHVHEARQFFHCFGCGEKGDVFSFLVKVEQRSFGEVLRDLAQHAGIELPERAMSPAERAAEAAERSEREEMLQAMEIAVAFFRGELAGSQGGPAREYLASRAIPDEIQARFQVGYAPASWDALGAHLRAKQVSAAIAERVGLVGANERGRYDFFRDRVMLPVLDRNKRPVGFSSRLLDPNAKDRKYVNSPDSPLFHKKLQLYGLHAALDPIRRAGTAIVVEGNFDVLALHAAGIEEAVAPMGTALTAEQIAQLGRVASRVVVIFDGDEAGLRAARKIVPLFVEADVDGLVARLPTGCDPDDFVRKEGAGAFRKLIAAARPMVEQFVDDVVGEADTSIPGKIAALETAAGLIAKVRNATARELYAGRLAGGLGLSMAQVARALRGAAGGRVPNTGVPASVPAAGGESHPQRSPAPDELALLVAMVSFPQIAKLSEAQQVLGLLRDPGLVQLCTSLIANVSQGGGLDVPSWLEAGPADVRNAVAAAVMAGGCTSEEVAVRTLKAEMARLEKLRIEQDVASLTKKAQEAAAQGDADVARAFYLEAQKLLQIKHLGKAQVQPRS